MSKKEEKKNSKESVDDVKMTEKDADAAKTAGAEDDGTQAQKENTDAENPKEASQSSENKKLKTKNAELEESLASAQKVSTLKQIEDLKLRRDYDSAVAILEQIPAEVLNIYAQSSHRGKERPIEQSL